MIDHISIPVSDLERALAFYTAAYAPLGYVVMMKLPEFQVAGLGVPPKPDVWLAQKPIGHTQHVALRAATRKQVDEFYAAAIKAGGKDNGPPGPRPHYHEHYYGAFVLDPDGHNVEACCHEPYLG
jgi:catechol 2,3-dioxygenase-like lactoylglutathione lyase family enzyme